MRLLLLGGPRFVGRALIESALERGHEVTTFNRGQTNPGAIRAVEELHGDRDGDLEALRGRSWDAVLDTSAYVPQVVRSAAELLADSVERYAFVSSISVYADYSQPIPEDAPLEQLDREPSRRRAARGLRELRRAQGPLRAGARGALRGAGADRPARPDRRAERPDRPLHYWARRPARGGTILAPPADTPVQVIDVRDLADWMVDMVERGETGAFNAVSPPGAHTFGSMLEACGARDVAWVDEEWLLAEGVDPWRDLPVWIPPAIRTCAGSSAPTSRAPIAAGLTFRPLTETARAAPEWTGEGRTDRGARGSAPRRPGQRRRHDPRRRTPPARASRRCSASLVFFDGPGGTQVPDEVIEAIARYFREYEREHERAVRDERAGPRSSPVARARRPAASSAAQPTRSSSART